MRTYGVEHERGGERVLERVRVDVLRAQHALDGAVEVVAQVRLRAVRRAHRVREADDPAEVISRVTRRQYSTSIFQ